MRPERPAGAGPTEQPRGKTALELPPGEGCVWARVVRREGGEWQLLSGRLRGQFNTAKGKALGISGWSSALTSTWLCPAQQTLPIKVGGITPFDPASKRGLTHYFIHVPPLQPQQS